MNNPLLRPDPVQLRIGNKPLASAVHVRSQDAECMIGNALGNLLDRMIDNVVSAADSDSHPVATVPG